MAQKRQHFGANVSGMQQEIRQLANGIETVITFGHAYSS